MKSDIQNQSTGIVGDRIETSRRKVSRTLLNERFFANLDRKLSLIEAPAGYGKTTLMLDWFSRLTQAGEVAVWVQAGTDAVRSMAIDEQVLRTLSTTLQNHPDDQTKDAEYLNAEAATTLRAILGLLSIDPKKTFLFFDDAHECNSVETLFLNKFMQQSDDNVHIVIGSREPLGIPLTKLRLNQRITDCGVEDLRLNRSEVAMMLADTVSEQMIDMFFEYSEGWVAALQFLRQSSETTHPLDLETGKDFGGQAGISEYLNEHFFGQLSEEHQAFLTDTAHLSTIDGDLADYVRKKKGSWDTLSDLASAHTLVFEVPGPVPGFRYHQLLRDFLRKRQIKLGESAVRKLNMRTAEWCFKNAELASAIRYALAAKDPNRAVEMLLQGGGVRIGMMQGAPRLEVCLDQIPIQLIHQSPRLLIARAYLLLKTARLDEAVLYLDEARQKIEPADDETQRELIMVDAHLRLYGDQHLTETQVAAMEHTACLTPVADEIMRGLLANFLCFFQIQAGNFDKAREFGDAAMAIFTDLKVLHLQFFMYLHLSVIDLDTGDYNTAYERRKKALELAHRNFRHDPALCALADIYESEIAYERGETDGLEVRLSNALAQASKAEGWSEAYLSGYETCLNVSFANGGFDAAINHIADAEATVTLRSSRRFSRHLRVLELELALDNQNRPETDRLASQIKSILDAREEEDRLRWRGGILARLALARATARSGQYGQALKLLAKIIEECHARGLKRYLLRAEILNVIFLSEMEDWTAADQSLKSVLELTHPDFFGAFIRHADLFAQAARDCVHNSGLANYSQVQTRKLSKILWRCTGHQPKETHTLLAELLTAREYSVLMLIARADANKVIARELDLSEATIKFHVKNIFAKLGVNSRKLAAEIAHMHGVDVAGEKLGD